MLVALPTLPQNIGHQMTDPQKLSRLRMIITESLRVQRDSGSIQYINVDGAVESVSSRQNHVIFARRGCGKTLLLKTAADQLPENRKAVYLNCEDFKKHTFPNVLIEILSSLFKEFDHHLHGWFGRKAKSKSIIRSIISDLDKLKASADEREENVKTNHQAENQINAEASSTFGVAGALSRLGIARKTKDETERTFVQKRSKLQKLDEWLPRLKAQMREFFNLSANVECIFIQIDDFYHLRRSDQAYVLDYIHRLCKDVPIYFKVATIRHASTLFVARAEQPIGAQERHDFQPIDIDYTFSDYPRTAGQNWAILSEFARQAGLSKSELSQLFKGEGFPRLVMAGGGVPRDVLSIFLQLLNQHSAIGKDEVRTLSKASFERRIQELRQDAQDDEQDGLIRGIYAIREFCSNKGTNIFLVEERILQANEDFKSLLHRLMDYRIINNAGSALTHKSFPGTYQAFAIDIGAYGQFRKMKDRFNEIDVSSKDAKEKMRSAAVLTEKDFESQLETVPVDAETKLLTAAE